MWRLLLTRLEKYKEGIVLIFKKFIVDLQSQNLEAGLLGYCSLSKVKGRGSPNFPFFFTPFTETITTTLKIQPCFGELKTKALFAIHKRRRNFSELTK